MLDKFKKLDTNTKNKLKEGVVAKFNGEKLAIYLISRNLLDEEKIDSNAKCMRVARQLAFQYQGGYETMAEVNNWIFQRLDKMKIPYKQIDVDKIENDLKEEFS